MKRKSWEIIKTVDDIIEKHPGSSRSAISCKAGIHLYNCNKILEALIEEGRIKRIDNKYYSRLFLRSEV